MNLTLGTPTYNAELESAMRDLMRVHGALHIDDLAEHCGANPHDVADTLEIAAGAKRVRAFACPDGHHNVWALPRDVSDTVWALPGGISDNVLVDPVCGPIIGPVVKWLAHSWHLTAVMCVLVCVAVAIWPAVWLSSGGGVGVVSYVTPATLGMLIGSVVVWGGIDTRVKHVTAGGYARDLHTHIYHLHTHDTAQLAWDAYVNQDNDARRELIETTAVSSAARCGVSANAALLALHIHTGNRDDTIRSVHVATGDDETRLRDWFDQGCGVIQRDTCTWCAIRPDTELLDT